MSLPNTLNQLLRAARWHRRTLGIAAAVACLFATLSALSPPQPQTTPVVVAAHELAAGSQLGAADLTTIEMPVELVPADALSEPAQAIGRTLTGGLTAGSPFTTASILNPRDPQAGPDERLVPIRLPDPASVALLQVGDRITVVGATVDGGAIEIASGVRVAALPTPTAGTLGGESGALVVVAADAETAARLAAASSQMRLAIVLG